MCRLRAFETDASVRVKNGAFGSYPAFEQITDQSAGDPYRRVIVKRAHQVLPVTPGQIVNQIISGFGELREVPVRVESVKFSWFGLPESDRRARHRFGQCC